jgi:hypothetical protein
LPGVKILEDSFNSGSVVAGNGADLWVAATYGVTEVNASTGAPVWLAEGPSYGFNQPAAISYDGEHLWIANSSGNSVTEIDAPTGSLIRVIRGASFDLNSPSAVAYGGGDVWIANSVTSSSSTVTEIDATTGALVRVISLDLPYPSDAAFLGGNVWIASGVGHLLAEIDASTGALIRVTGQRPTAYVALERRITACGGDLWSTDISKNAVDEFSGTSGALVRVVRFASRGAILHFPSAVTCDGEILSVANVYAKGSWHDGLVTELDASTGAVIRVLQGTTYGFGLAGVLASEGGRLFVLGSNDAASEIDESTGALIRVVRGAFYGFYSPDAMVDVGSDVWVAGGAGSTNTVSEVSATTDEPIRVVVGDARNGIDGPTALAYDGKHIWVANGTGDSVTELDASSGTVVRTIRGPCTVQPSGATVQCGGANAIVADAKDVWVENLTYGQITELDTATGAVVKNISMQSNPTLGMTLGGGHLWIVDLASLPGSDSISELDPATDHVIKVLVPTKVRLADGSHIASVDTFGNIIYNNDSLWVLASDGKTGNDAVAEFNASTGAQVRVVDGASYGLNTPTAIATDGRHVWVANGDCVNANCNTGTSITEINASNGTLAGVLNSPYYGFENPSAFAYNGSDLWVANVTNSVTVIPVPSALDRAGLAKLPS